MTGHSSWRRLFVLARWLPADSMLVTSMTGGESAWGLSEHLLAAAVDELRGANWQRAGRGPRPKPVPRPGVDVGPTTERIGGKRTYSPDEMRALLDRHSLGRS